VRTEHQATPRSAPRFLDVNGRSLFLWHHAPPPAVRRGAGIVLCPALEFEHASAYRTWRILAERLAAIGFDVLRIDYDGTGNSAGGPEDPNRAAAWLRSIACAIAECRQLAGSDRVSLVGLRAGALLALQAAAAEPGIERLVLWSPPTSGRAYVRELRAHAGLSRQDHADDDTGDARINAAGHLVAVDTIKSLERWRLDALTTCPARDVLIVERDDRPTDPTVGTYLAKLGSRVDAIRPPGTANMLVVPHLAQVPEEVLCEVIGWFRDWRPSASAIDATELKQDSTAVAVADAYQERAVRFGFGNRLFGVVTSPRTDSPNSSSIVLFNTGVEHHVGPHRSHVSLARACASRGHPVLRFDLAGIGDSAPRDGEIDHNAYPPHMLSDAREAIAFIRAENPGRPLIAIGLCSGGWLAFRAAREGLAVDAIVSVNPPLYLREGATAAQWRVEQRELERYRQSIRRPSKWAKVLRGGAAYSAFARTAISAVSRRAARLTSTFGEARPAGLAKDLCLIAERKIRTLFIFSRGDDGLGYFQRQAQPALRQANVREFIEQSVVDGAGHSFRPLVAQQRLTQLIVDFVNQNSGVAHEQQAGAHERNDFRDAVWASSTSSRSFSRK